MIHRCFLTALGAGCAALLLNGPLHKKGQATKHFTNHLACPARKSVQ